MAFYRCKSRQLNLHEYIYFWELAGSRVLEVWHGTYTAREPGFKSHSSLLYKLFRVLNPLLSQSGEGLVLTIVQVILL